MNVILFESEEDILDLLSYNLEKSGFHVKACAQKDVNCSCLEDFDPDLVLVGNVGPDEDILEFTQEIRASFQSIDPAVICLTTAEEAIPTMKKAGLFDKVLSTPITPKFLIKEIFHLLEKKLLDVA